MSIKTMCVLFMLFSMIVVIQLCIEGNYLGAIGWLYAGGFCFLYLDGEVKLK